MGRIKSIVVGAASRVNQMFVRYDNGNECVYGRPGGGTQEFLLEPGEFITAVHGTRSGLVID